jgi:hypothetical protein
MKSSVVFVVCFFLFLATDVMGQECRRCMPGAAPVIYQPRVYYQPYQLERASYYPISYPTPLRDYFFGTGYWQYQYRPMSYPGVRSSKPAEKSKPAKKSDGSGFSVLEPSHIRHRR